MQLQWLLVPADFGTGTACAYLRATSANYLLAQGTWLCGFKHWWPCAHVYTPKEPLTWLPEPPSEGGHQGQCQQQWSLWVRTPGGKQHRRITHPTDISWGWRWSGSFPSGRAPVSPTSHHSLEPDLGASIPTTREQTLPPTDLWQSQSKEEAPPNIQCSLWSPQGQTHQQGWAEPDETHGKHTY